MLAQGGGGLLPPIKPLGSY